MYAFCVSISTLSKSHAESTWMPFAFEYTILRVTAQSFVPPLFFSFPYLWHPSFPILVSIYNGGISCHIPPVPTLLPNECLYTSVVAQSALAFSACQVFLLHFQPVRFFCDKKTSKAITLCVVFYFLMLVPMQNSILICDRIIYAFCVCILTLSVLLAKPTWMPFVFECEILRVSAQSFVPPLLFSFPHLWHPSFPILVHIHNGGISCHIPPGLRSPPHWSICTPVWSTKSSGNFFWLY